ncbi:SufD family Fe-S cluster assembly protein [Candidatus Parvarchaeota archaeon]|uniref:SufD family Fe-S cluster assembly protein n=1 Tax=Candidatus Acidifodinimicrobium mancum TaxID=2898728 RepID=A0A8T3UR95_9ARCH|nr:SufD family Fe-S cluster assembly protein [Candidatus Acidifodinimicrobium mancum]
MTDLFKSYIDMKLNMSSIPKWLIEYKQKEFKKFRETEFEANPLFKKDSEAREKVFLNEEEIISYLMNQRLDNTANYRFNKKSEDIIDRDIILMEETDPLRSWVEYQDAYSDKMRHLDNALFTPGRVINISGGGTKELDLTETTKGKLEISKDVFYVDNENMAKIILELTNSVENAKIYKNIDIFTGENSRLTILIKQNFEADAIALINIGIHSKGDIEIISVDKGGKTIRYKIYAELLSDNSSYKENKIMICSGKQDIDVTDLVRHVGKGTKSLVNFRTSAEGEAKVVIKEVITIEKEAENSDAFLSSDGIILSENTKINSIPALEIRTSNVKAKHSASTKHLDYQSEVYCLSRGIDEEDAKKLIVEGFLFGGLDLKDEELKERIEMSNV